MKLSRHTLIGAEYHDNIYKYETYFNLTVIYKHIMWKEKDRITQNKETENSYQKFKR